MRLSEGIAGYIAHKRATGLKYESAESHFKAFLTCTGDVPLGLVITENIATFLNHYSSARRRQSPFDKPHEVVKRGDEGHIRFLVNNQ